MNCGGLGIAVLNAYICAKKFYMKKLLGFLFCALVVAICGCRGNKAKVVKYDKDMKEAFETAQNMNKYCGYLSDLSVVEWSNELRSGKNPNEGMSEFLGSGTAKVFADGIKLDKQRIDSLNKILTDAPEERKEAYNDFVALVSEINSYADLAMKPSGSLIQYSGNVANHKSKSSQLIEQFSMKYASILNGEKNQ